jgi:hypothetical protein
LGYLDPTLASLDRGDSNRVVAAATVATEHEVSGSVIAAAAAARGRGEAHPAGRAQIRRNRDGRCA